MKMHGLMLLLLAAADLTALPPLAKPQLLANSEDSSATVANPAQAQRDLTYTRPTETTKLRNYAFDAFGPYSLAGATLAAGIGLADVKPPDWKQGAVGYGERFGSDFGIAAIATTTRYALAEAFREDTLYYRCDCKGILPRARHVVTSSFIARRGDDGHRVFSFPALIAPYAGAMVAVYGWYPRRYGARDAFRMGNYSLLGYLGGNIVLEFIYSGPHSLISRMHLDMSHGGLDPGSPP